MPDPMPDKGAADQDSRDEALGRLLDEHFEALSTNAAPTAPVATDPDVTELQPVLEHLNQLRAYLVESDRETLSWAEADTGSHEMKPDRPAPTRVGKYEVVRPLGRGGQASALLAFDPDLRRHVVLKCYHDARTSAEQELIFKEGQALARVHSPFVAKCFSAERDDGVPYLVVEYIPGKSLAEPGRSRRFDVDGIIRLIGQLAEGLATVHACGLLHRDIKPANIIIGDDGVPRLVDFGLACSFAGDELRRISGTLPYMAPEQARGESERIDARTDVYGLGAVFYELLTGRPPHTNPDHDALWTEVRDGHVVPAAERHRELDSSVNDLCMRCLAPDPGQRFASAADLGAAVRRWQSRRRWKSWLDFRTRVMPAIGVVAAGLLLSAVIWQPWRQSSQPAPDDSRPKDLVKGPGEVPAPVGVMPYQDFPVTVEAIGGAADVEGQLVIPLGSDVSFRVTPARTAYLAVWAVSGDTVVQLFPNKWESDHLIERGEPRTIPGRKAYAIRATSVSTTPEKVIVFASTTRFEPPAATQFRSAGPEGGFVALNPTEFEIVLRGLELVALESRQKVTEPDRGPSASAKVIVPFVVRAK